jgi:hypothetical protein
VIYILSDIICQDKNDGKKSQKEAPLRSRQEGGVFKDG